MTTFPRGVKGDHRVAPKRFVTRFEMYQSAKFWWATVSRIVIDRCPRMAPEHCAFQEALLRSAAVGPVAQWLELAAHNRSVVGSSPTGPTTQVRDPNHFNGLSGFWANFLLGLPIDVRFLSRAAASRAACSRSAASV
jgi:hypothetical protein